MAAATVVTWACLVAVLVAADDVPLPLQQLSLLRHGQAQGIEQPQSLLLETLRQLHNRFQEQDLPSGESQLFNKVRVESTALTQPLLRPISFSVAERSRMLNQALSSGLKETYAAIRHRSPIKENVHSRQKRYTLKHKLRSIAVPLSVFNFLGFLPVRVPGLPYHNDLPSPDVTHYETKHDVFIPRYRRRKTFRRF